MAVVCLTIGAPVVAAAQSVPYDPAIDVQLFEYAVGPKTFFAVADGDVAAANQVAMDFMVTFLKNPLTVYNVDDQQDVITGERTRVVESVLAGELSGAYGLKDRFQIGASLPLVFSMSGQGLDPASAGASMDSLQITGLGDLRVEGKARIWRQGAMRLAGAIGLTLPSSFGAGGSEFIGDDLPTFRGHLAWQWASADGKASVGLNAGLILRKPRDIYASEVGQQFTYGAAGAYAVTDRFSLIAETFGRTGMTSFDTDNSPIEVEGGLRILGTKAIAVVLGGGAGVVKGIGSPDLRVFASVGWAPDTRDTDGDGVPNNKDRCVLVPEDKDGFEDSDGCPDDDNDGDRRMDSEDKCPLEKEDIDGFEDDDGCPDLDNDGDGIPDLEDRICPLDKEDGLGPQPTDGCPIDKRDTDVDGIYDDVDQCYDQEEDMDGFEDWDGCPDLDQDHDGVADDEDQCPVCPEDVDGFEDGDGCPELDNDHDGLLDAVDQCPDEAEVMNGIDDFDGCPDEGGAEVATLEGDRMVFAGAITFDSKGLSRAGKLILDQAALLMLQHREVQRWTVAVASKHTADVRKRGGWVLQHLKSRGVDLDSIELLTSKEKNEAVAVVVSERVDALPGPADMCPAGEVTPRPAPPGRERGAAKA
ncbi:MAG: transporter, partial [Myxococcales bacterium]|nr:transporter [Myxococcales bacterium]